MCYALVWRSDHREPIVAKAGCSDKAKGNDLKLYFLPVAQIYSATKLFCELCLKQPHVGIISNGQIRENCVYRVMIFVHLVTASA